MIISDIGEKVLNRGDTSAQVIFEKDAGKYLYNQPVNLNTQNYHLWVW